MCLIAPPFFFFEMFLSNGGNRPIASVRVPSQRLEVMREYPRRHLVAGFDTRVAPFHEVQSLIHRARACSCSAIDSELNFRVISFGGRATIGAGSGTAGAITVRVKPTALVP